MFVGKYIVNCDTRYNLFSCKYFLQTIDTNLFFNFSLRSFGQFTAY